MWHFLAMKSIPTEDGFMRSTKAFSRLMRNISSKHKGDYYCYGCFNSFRTQSVLEKHYTTCKGNSFCQVNLPEPGTNIKQHKFGTKPLRMNDIIYLDLEGILKKYDSYSNHLKYSYSENITHHDACGYSLTTVRNHTKQSITTYHKGKDSLLKLCKDLHEHGLELINTKKLPMTPLTNEKQAIHDNSDKCHVCNRPFITNKNHRHYKKLIKVIDHDHYTGKYRGAAHSICNLRYETQKDIPVVIHNGSNYDFHLLITELAKDFRSNIHCIGENTEKCMSFSIPLKKQMQMVNIQHTD